MDLRLEAAIAEGYRLQEEAIIKKKEEEFNKMMAHYKKYAPTAQKWIDEHLFSEISKAIEKQLQNVWIRIDNPVATTNNPFETTEKLYEVIAFLVSKIDGLYIFPEYSSKFSSGYPTNMGELIGYRISWKK
jgi:transketolase